MDMSQEDRKWMRQAIRLSVENVDNGGGPFGAVIVKEHSLIAEGVNRVTANNDPTAHAEVSAIYWAGIRRICYGNTKADAEHIHFGDKFIYDEIAKPCAERSIPMESIMRDEALEAFRKWEEKEDKIPY